MQIVQQLPAARSVSLAPQGSPGLTVTPTSRFQTGLILSTFEQFMLITSEYVGPNSGILINTASVSAILDRDSFRECRNLSTFP